MMLAARASGLIAISAIGVRALGFQRTKSSIESLGRRRARPAADCVRAIRRARRYGLFRGNCLSQSLALLWMLRRAGHDGAIQIGVKPGVGRMLAHAWVELDGQTIDPAAIAADYAPLLG
jgi:hypothetical protein